MNVTLENFEEVSGARQCGHPRDPSGAGTAFASFDGQQARIVELRFFGGFSIEEAAETLGSGTPRSSVSEHGAGLGSAMHSGKLISHPSDFLKRALHTA